MFEVPGVFRTSEVEFSAAAAELFIEPSMRILVVLPTLGLYKSRETGIDFPIMKVSCVDFLLTSSSI
jgi:hypothetical protein